MQLPHCIGLLIHPNTAYSLGFPDITGRVRMLNWRRGSESNRRPRLCRPLHNHSATPPGVLVKPTLYVGRDVVCIQLKGKSMVLSPMIWSGKRDSNSRPIPWQGIALPTELFPRQRDAHCNDGGLFVKHKCAFALTGLGRAAMLKSLFVFLSSAYVRQYQVSRRR